MIPDNKYGSRKFQLSVGIQVFGSLALAWGWLDAAAYANISVVNIGSYNISNAVVHYTQREDK